MGPTASPARHIARASLAALLATVGFAHAQDDVAVGPPRNGYDGDIDLIKPMFAPEVNPGMDVPTSQLPGTVRTGIAFGYTRNPLVLYEFEQEVGAVVANRFQAYAGVSVDISRAFTARLVIPAYFQWGSTVPRYAADGFAVGDITIGGHVALVRRPAGGLGIRLDVSTPTSRSDFYAGERLPRFNPAIIGMADVGKFRLMVDVGANLRIQDVETKEEFTLSQEILGSMGFRVAAMDGLSVGATVYGRFGFGNSFGAAELAGEALATVGYRPVKFLWVDVSAGRGFTRGYGSSDFRTLVQLRFQRVRKLRPGEEGYEVNADGTQDLSKKLVFTVKQGGDGFQGTDITPPDIPGVTDVDGLLMSFPEEPPEPEWDEGQVLRVKDNRIELRFALNFKVGTAQLLPESLKYLDAVADVLQNDARILHMMIEGHASPEGPYDRNYTLSLDRAQAIWRYLVEQGVHPTRMSTRAMGEVVPIEATGGTDEFELSRRVVFEIVKQLPSGQTAPEYDLDLLAPWNGAKLKLAQPRMPTAEEIEAAESRLDRLADQKREQQRARPTPGDDPPLNDTSFSDDGDDLTFDDDASDAPADAPTSDTPSDAPPSDPPAPVEEESP